MTPPDELPHLTPAELEVMKVLWRAERLSAREVHENLGDRRDWAYSTTRTMIERMVRKGLVVKKTFHGLHVYSAAVSRAEGLAKLVREFAAQVLESSHVPVVSLFAETGSLTVEEIEELRLLLEQSAEEEA
jgi:predicted transcriptional regulator